MTAEIWAAIAATFAAFASGGALFLQYRARHHPLRDELYRIQARIIQDSVPVMTRATNLAVRTVDARRERRELPPANERAQLLADLTDHLGTIALFLPKDAVSAFGQFTALAELGLRDQIRADEEHEGYESKFSGAFGKWVTAVRALTGTEALSADVLQLAKTATKRASVEVSP